MELKINVIWAIGILIAIGMIIYERLSNDLGNNSALDETDRIFIRILFMIGTLVVELPLIYYWIK